MKAFFVRIFQNRNLLELIAVFTVLSGIYLVYNTLYPWRGDDFICHVMLRRQGVFEVIKDGYTGWTLRLGNVVCTFFEACESKVLFNICNTVIQTFLVWLFCGVAVGRFLRPGKAEDVCLLLFTAGISVFVCRPADTVYWVPGAALYSWAAVVYLGCVALLFKFEKSAEFSWLPFVLMAFAGFCSGYANENVALTGFVFLVARAFFKPSPVIWTTVISWMAGAIFLFTTPGSLKRIEASGGNSLTLSSMIAKVPEIAGFYVASSLIPLFFLIVLSVILWKNLTRDVLIRAGIAITLSLFAALVFAGCPLPPMRSYYVCSVLIIMGCCIIFDGAKISFKQRRLIMMISLAAGFGMLLVSAPDFIHIHQDEVKREQLIAAQRIRKAAVVEVPEHRVLRRSFLQYVFIEDITADTEFWLNVNAAMYYNVNKIRSIPTGEHVPLYRDRFMKLFKSGRK